MNMLRPISRKYDQRRARVPQGARHARRDDRRPADSGASEGAGAAGVRPRRPSSRRRARVKNGANLASVLSITRCAGATSACCCRCRARAWATPRSRRSPTTSSSSASGHVGRDGDHRAGHGLGLGQHPTTTAAQGRRRVRPQRREDLRHRRRALPTPSWCGRRSTSARRAAIKSFVVDEGHARA